MSRKTHPYREVVAAPDRLTVKVDGVHVEAGGPWVGPFEVRYDGTCTAAGIRVYADGIEVTTRVLVEPARKTHVENDPEIPRRMQKSAIERFWAKVR